MNEHLEMACRPEGTRWVCNVIVGDDPGATHHEVTISRDLLAELRPGAEAPDELVRDSFEFLLRRGFDTGMAHAAIGARVREKHEG